MLDTQVHWLPVEQIAPNPHQPRREFAPGPLAELAESIRRHGIIQPLTVRHSADGWELIAGERRLRAAKLAGLQTVPCLEMQVDKQDSAILALIENIQRRDLHYLEEATAIAAYLRQSGSTQEEAAALLGQIPCMRMDAPVSERAALVDGQTVGIVYHTVQFCDYYAPGLTAPEQFHLPVLKIETDCSRQTFTSGGGQLSTRLGAFAESLNAVPDTENKEAPAMNTNAQYAAGIDSGSASTDAVILDRSGKICGWAIVPTGAGAATGARQALEQALTMAGIAESDLGSKVYTGYGREFLGDDGAAVTEITCHARGAHHLDPAVRTVIDIGGQDSKVIRLSESGAVETFAMNDKCAAGTGRFLEMMARTLQMKLPEMSELGLDWHNDVTISSMCTVFAESEVVSLIARSTAPADIIHGLNKSVAGKTAALARRTGGVAPFMMTGGVARNRGVVKELETALKAPVEVSEYSQLCGSLGAALFALEKMGVKL